MTIELKFDIGDIIYYLDSYEFKVCKGRVNGWEAKREDISREIYIHYKIIPEEVSRPSLGDIETREERKVGTSREDLISKLQ